MSDGSDRLESHLSIELDAITRSWFDGPASRLPWGGEFFVPVTVEELLKPQATTFWPGFMPPDLLPILGNGMGDWLCLRIDRHNRVREVVAWNHGGGDYLPFGRSIAEALLYDHLRHRQHSPSVPQSQVAFGRMHSECEGWLVEHLAMEASTHRDFQRWSEPDESTHSSNSDDSVRRAIGLRFDPVYQQRLEWIAAQGWALHAVRCEQIESCLSYPFWTFASPKLANQWQVDWNRDMVAWLFDGSLFPSPFRLRYEEALLVADLASVEREIEQNWGAIQDLVLASIDAGCDVAWAFDLAGWSFMRQGDLEAACRYWERGCPCSVFSDQSIRFRTHWCDPTIGKFSAAMLHRAGRTPATIPSGYWQALTSSSPNPSPVARVSRYWQSVAEQSEGWDGYLAWYAAGWDMGVPSRQLWPTLLAGLQQSASAANASGLAQLAAWHARALSRG